MESCGVCIYRDFQIVQEPCIVCNEAKYPVNFKLDKVDIVVPLSSESRFNNEELKYSLRSFETHFKQLGSIWIIGFKPEWITNINYIEASDSLKQNKDGNIIKKIYDICLKEELSDDFIFLSDDQLILKDLRKGDFEPRYCNVLETYPFSETQNRWKQRLKRTYDKLKSENKTTYDYDSHLPTLFNKKRFLEIINLYPEYYNEGEGYTINTLYCNNLNLKEHKFENSIVAKFQQINNFSLEEIIDKCNDKLFLTYDDRGVTNSFFEFLKIKFPKKSKYES